MPLNVSASSITCRNTMDTQKQSTVSSSANQTVRQSVRQASTWISNLLMCEKLQAADVTANKSYRRKAALYTQNSQGPLGSSLGHSTWQSLRS